MNDPTIHAHQPAAEVAVGWQDGTAWFADPDSDGTAPCQVCGVPLAWQRHPDRDQHGWRQVPTGDTADPSEVACTCGAALDIRPRWGAGTPAEAGLWQWLHADGSTPADHTPRPAAGGDRR